MTDIVPRTTVFVIKNTVKDGRTLKIFNVSIEAGDSFDLLSLEYVSESDIRNSLLKGVLKSKIE